MHTSFPRPPAPVGGFSLPEVMIASAILAAVVTSSVRMTSSSVLGMNRSKLHQQASSAMAARMETLRYEEAHVLSAGLVLFSFLVLLWVYSLNRRAAIRVG